MKVINIVLLLIYSFFTQTSWAGDLSNINIDLYNSKSSQANCTSSVNIEGIASNFIEAVIVDEELLYLSKNEETQNTDIIYENKLLLSSKNCLYGSHYVKIFLNNGIIINKNFEIQKHLARGLKLTGLNLAVKNLAEKLTSKVFLDEVASISGRSTANAIKKYSTYISKKLTELSTWSDLTTESIRLQVVATLIANKVPQSVAQPIGLAIKLLSRFFL